MEKNEIEYLKRKIKRTYKRYIGERTDGTATLTDVAKFFNISIDETRIQDYVIKEIDYDKLSIELIDTKNDISYVASYTNKADMLDCFGSEINFINLISVNPIRKVESLYYIGIDTPIISRMRFFKDDYELIFEKEMANSFKMFSDNRNQFEVRYLKNVNYESKNVQQLLLRKVYAEHYSNEECIGTFERTDTYGLHHYIEYNGTQDNYTYIRNNSIIYGISHLKQKDVCSNLCGICSESMDVKVSDYLPTSIYGDKFPVLDDSRNKSVMMFMGGPKKEKSILLQYIKMIQEYM